MSMTKMKSDEELGRELSQATKGLTFMSESDYPLEVVELDAHKDITDEWLRALARCDSSAPIQETTVEEFFSVASGEQEWKGAAEIALAKRYQKLIRLLKKNLTDVKVHRVGETNIAVYVLGKSREGSVMGISTRVVET